MPVNSGPTLSEVFAEHAKYVWRTLRYLGVAEAEVPDVCQEVFITVQRKLPSFEGRSSVRTWLYGICIRVAADHRRKAYVRRERATAEPLAETGERTGAEPDSRVERRAAVRALLDLLDDEKREIVVLYEIEGFTMKEVAEIVGCPMQTAYSRLHAARELMLAALERDEKGTR
ncbi:MAG TPA: RNA polymerase sigma factor [Polyangiaceae bacterium]